MLINREISWLSFNHRVLQEAMDPTVPLVERMRFLGIFSNNLDEFFRVRVATVKRVIDFDKKGKTNFIGSPQKVLNEIHETVIEQQKLFRKTYAQILQELEKKGIFILNEKQLSSSQEAFVQEYYKEKVEPSLVPLVLTGNLQFPYLKDKAIYLFVALINTEQQSKEFALIEIPTKQVSRFLILPEHQDGKALIYLDDVIRANLKRIFSIFKYDAIESYVFKITRDAELDLDDDISASFYDKVKQSLQKRKKGTPTRLVYDEQMPNEYLKFLLKAMKIKDDGNIISGGRYHNFRDFMEFPSFDMKEMVYKKSKPLNHPDLHNRDSLLDAISEQEVLLHFPYQSFDYVIDVLRESAIDPRVKRIQIALYRVHNNSRIINALLNAAKNGKRVDVTVELQARFDEASNLEWSQTLQEEGINVHFGIDGLKVHSKILLITRKEIKGNRKYVYVGTGNFHEGTAKVYSDIALLSANQKLAGEVEQVFEFIKKPYIKPVLKHLLVSPLNMRHAITRMIDREIEHLEHGRPCGIVLKVNNLVDQELISKLVEASELGVKVKLLIRGICALGLKEGVKGNMEVRSIVDAYLEHARIMIFSNNEDPQYYISSADWMTRNIDHRVEVGCPIYSEDLRAEIDEFIQLQWNDNKKSRQITHALNNKYITNKNKPLRAQHDYYTYLKRKSHK